ncbi:TIGR03083 family protein [Micromonospora pattaloongensis]|uniref:TIGR03083 family protein n=1 Tax=Micromonospora pattaloongensis TaxID=405436 RepID=A0A1H3S7S8_9ACTN|nr:maleylpyruvate isomerase family mycothiol-dependent enzyme [Micromonospora pattaloongensis]SDZ33780.1 TIGR03083 family protein [Micromonospora pattaloongensis]
MNRVTNTDAAGLAEMAGLDPFDALDCEAARIETFYRGLAPADWSAPTRCAGWDRRDLLAHLAAIEDYVRAGLDASVGQLLSRSGGGDLAQRNARGIQQRAGLSVDELLAQWRAASADNRRRLRERGADGLIETAAGDYPVGRQVFYLASELATHADDAGVPESEGERELRLQWRVRFARVAVAEAERGVTVVPDGGAQLVRWSDGQARLSESDFVAVVADRLDTPALPPPIHDALVVLA